MPAMNRWLWRNIVLPLGADQTSLLDPAARPDPVAATATSPSIVPGRIDGRILSRIAYLIARTCGGCCDGHLEVFKRARRNVKSGRRQRVYEIF